MRGCGALEAHPYRHTVATRLTPVDGRRGELIDGGEPVAKAAAQRERRVGQRANGRGVVGHADPHDRPALDRPRSGGHAGPRHERRYKEVKRRGRADKERSDNDFEPDRCECGCRATEQPHSIDAHADAAAADGTQAQRPASLWPPAVESEWRAQGRAGEAEVEVCLVGHQVGRDRHVQPHPHIHRRTEVRRERLHEPQREELIPIVAHARAQRSHARKQADVEATCHLLCRARAALSSPWLVAPRAVLAHVGPAVPVQMFERIGIGAVLDSESALKQAFVDEIGGRLRHGAEEHLDLQRKGLQRRIAVGQGQTQQPWTSG